MTVSFLYLFIKGEMIMFHKKMKTALILSLALTSFGAFSAPSFAAGYTLNPEVKDEIGRASCRERV